MGEGGVRVSVLQNPKIVFAQVLNVGLLRTNLRLFARIAGVMNIGRRIPRRRRKRPLCFRIPMSAS